MLVLGKPSAPPHTFQTMSRKSQTLPKKNELFSTQVFYFKSSYTLVLRRIKMIDAVVLSKVNDLEIMLRNIEAHLNRIDAKLDQIHNDLP